MESKRGKIFAAAAIIAVLVLVLVLLRRCLGLSKTFYLIAGADLAAVLAILIWVFVLCAVVRQRSKLLAKRKAFDGEQLRLEYSFLRKVAGLPAKFRYEELEAATDNFQALLGRGASASVFKGILEDGTSIAVKRIERAEHGEREFRAEVAAIASVQHVNLVRLLGYCCILGGARFLVYEFIYNGSLDVWIFPRRRPDERTEQCLPWHIRYRVAIDVAKALSYLHHDCRSRILHLDVKPENILLDENFRARVSDFGLSKLMGRDESRVITTVRGTRGYLAPEWLLEHGVSEKSDVYSYGMVLLELVGGRRNVSLVGNGDNSRRKWSYFPRIVMEKVREGKVMEIVDERLLNDGRIEEREVRVLVDVALWCIQEKAKLRPSMASVVDMLEGRVAVDMPPPQTEMIVVDLLSIDEGPPVLTAVNAGATSPHIPDPMLAAVNAGTTSAHIPDSSTYTISMSVLSGR